LRLKDGARFGHFRPVDGRLQGTRGAIRADPEQERCSLEEGCCLRGHGEEVEGKQTLAFYDEDRGRALGGIAWQVCEVMGKTSCCALIWMRTEFLSKGEQQTVKVVDDLGLSKQ
jgi:hypothetical protein